MSSDLSNGTYSASVLGTISSHLEGLQGFDSMCLELIQNADDAKATEIVFDITDDALWVHNDSEFSDQDFARITQVASAGKSGDSELIGRFGIGFVSTYQVTDHPQIISADKRLTLIPEQQHYTFENVGHTNGTSFRLEWAFDSDSATRAALKQSSVNQSEFDSMAQDLLKMLRRGILFLRHVRSIQLMRNGELVEACHFDRSVHKRLTVTFDTEESTQHWIVLTTDIESRADKLLQKYPQLSLNRRQTLVTLAFRANSEIFRNGFFYAYLPTEQLTGMPFHINGDFFTEPDRKSLVFSGGRHQQAWNELIVRSAAVLLAHNLEALRDILGPGRLWELISKAALLRDRARTQSVARVLGMFWHEIFERSKSNPTIIWTAAGEWSSLDACYLSPAKFTDSEYALLHTLRLNIVGDELRPFHKVLTPLGVRVLGLTPIINAIEAQPSFLNVTAGDTLQPADVETKFVPLWRLLNKYFEVRSLYNTIPKRFFQLPLGVRADGTVAAFDTLVRLPAGFNSDRWLAVFPTLALCHADMLAFDSLTSKVPVFCFAELVRLLEARATDASEAADLLGTDIERLRTFYDLLTELHTDAGSTGLADVDRLKALPIFKTGGGFVDATSAMLPGEFELTDDLELAVDAAVLSTRNRVFMSDVLGIETCSLSASIRVQLPRVLASENSVDYRRLMSVLVAGQAQLDSDALSALQTSSVVPVGIDQWVRPAEAIWWDEQFSGAFEPHDKLFVDVSRIDDSAEMRLFFCQLGVRSYPSAAELVDRMAWIAGSGSMAEYRAASAGVLAMLSDQFDDWQLNNPGAIRELARLKAMACFPSSNVESGWHKPGDLVVAIGSDIPSNDGLYWPAGQNYNTNLLGYLGVQTVTVVEQPGNELLPVCDSSENAGEVAELARLLERIQSNPDSITFNHQRELDRILSNISTELRLGFRTSIDDLQDLLGYSWFSTAAGNWATPDVCIIDDCSEVGELFGGELSDLLVADRFEFSALYSALSIPRLSEISSRQVSTVEGIEAQELVQARFVERAVLLTKVIENAYHGTDDELIGRFESIDVRSCESLQLTAAIASNRYSAATAVTNPKAGYDFSENRLYIRSPLDYGMWPRVFRELLIAILPGLSEHELRNAVLSCSTVMAAKQVNDSSIWLLGAGFDGIEGQNLDVELGAVEVTEEELALSGTEVPVDSPSSVHQVLNEQGDQASIEEIELSGLEDPSEDLIVIDQDEEHGTAPSNVIPLTSVPEEPGKMASAQDLEAAVNPDTPGLILVSPNSVEVHGIEFGSDLQRAGRFAAVTYEREMGRSPEPHSSEAKGWDITSFTPNGNTRYIKVVTISGEWRNNPVYISQFAYKMAFEHSDEYWLYVVELAKGQTPRVMAIKDPVSKVTSVCFNDEWSTLVESDEKARRHSAGSKAHKGSHSNKSDAPSGSLLSSFRGLFKP